MDNYHYGIGMKGASEMEFNTSERHINREVVEVLRPSLAEPTFKGAIIEGCECKYATINLKDFTSVL